MKNIVNFLNGFNIQTILSLVAISWYFTKDLKIEIQKEINEIRRETENQSRRSDKLYEMFIDLLKSQKRD